MLWRNEEYQVATTGDTNTDIGYKRYITFHVDCRRTWTWISTCVVNNHLNSHSSWLLCMDILPGQKKDVVVTSLLNQGAWTCGARWSWEDIQHLLAGQWNVVTNEDLIHFQCKCIFDNGPCQMHYNNDFLLPYDLSASVVQKAIAQSTSVDLGQVWRSR